jgi:RNA polymerase sigma-70 factor (family 1)
MIFMDYRLLTDEVLLKLLRINDELAFKELYKRHWQKLFYSVLNKIDSKEVAEDIVQTVFTDLWYRREGLSIDNIVAYLQTAVRNRVINYIRFAISNKAHLSNFTERQKPGQDDADMRLLVQELNTAIDRAIRQMPEKTQTVFRLSRFERQSNKEISRIMNLSEKAVEYHIRQSLKILRIYLKDFMLVDYFLVTALMIN